MSISTSIALYNLVIAISYALIISHFSIKILLQKPYYEDFDHKGQITQVDLNDRGYIDSQNRRKYES